MKTTPYISLEYRHLNGDRDVMYFVKNIKNELMILSPIKIKPLKNKSKHKPKQILLFPEAMELLCRCR